MKKSLKFVCDNEILELCKVQMSQDIPSKRENPTEE